MPSTVGLVHPFDSEDRSVKGWVVNISSLPSRLPQRAGRRDMPPGLYVDERELAQDVGGNGRTPGRLGSQQRLVQHEGSFTVEAAHRVNEGATQCSEHLSVQRRHRAPRAGNQQRRVEPGAIPQVDTVEQKSADLRARQRAVFERPHVQQQLASHHSKRISAKQSGQVQAPPEIGKAPAQRGQRVVGRAEQLGRQHGSPHCSLSQRDPSQQCPGLASARLRARLPLTDLDARSTEQPHPYRHREGTSASGRHRGSPLQCMDVSSRKALTADTPVATAYLLQQHPCHPA